MKLLLEKKKVVVLLSGLGIFQVMLVSFFLEYQNLKVVSEEAEGRGDGDSSRI